MAFHTLRTDIVTQIINIQKKYDEKVPSKYIMYLDANNLYSWAMSQFLPTGSFKWITEKEIIKLDLDAYKENRKKV